MRGQRSATWLLRAYSPRALSVPILAGARQQRPSVPGASLATLTGLGVRQDETGHSYVFLIPPVLRND